MANIDLSNFYRRNSDKKSPVDSDIVLNRAQTAEEIYSDLKFDIAFSEITERPLNAQPNTRDLQKITNRESVMNALKNILNTRYGTRLLDPEIHTNFESYLFEELTQPKAYLIVDELQSKLSLLEPRVAVDKISVAIDWINDTYYLNLFLSIPSLNEKIKLAAKLDKTGIYFS